MGGTVIYMPPEEYEPNKTRRADVKQDMYRCWFYTYCLKYSAFEFLILIGRKMIRLFL